MEATLNRQQIRWAILMIALAVVAWVATVWQAQSMVCGMCDSMSIACGMCMGTGKPWALSLALFLGMWTTMMAAMMLPAVTPMVMVFSMVSRRRREMHHPFVPTWVFLIGYFLAWVIAGLVAFAAVRLIQWWMGLEPRLSQWSDPIAGWTLIVAGLYQWTPLKGNCLKHCRSPLHFLFHGWHQGYSGAIWMGLTHGLFCIGCCWGLMLVLFAVGLMNLGWMAGLTAVMALEKILPQGPLIGYLAGGIIVIAGCMLLF